MTAASVVIPTIGRPGQLTTALESLAACDPAPAEVVVVDQSGGDETRDVVARFASAGARWVPSAARSIGVAVNAGFEAASHDVVFVTNDDCSVAPDWVAVGTRELAATPGAIVTGSVHPVGDPEATPSLKQDDEPHDYTGTRADGALYGANMVTSRAALLSIGGFDPRVRPSAEDNDLCYRWLKAGRSLRYVPALRIWHHDWRDEAQMKELYIAYGIGQGVFYAKHLRRGDLRMLRFLARDLRHAIPDGVQALRDDDPIPPWVKGTVRGLAIGLWRGARTFAREPAP